ncbi:MAG: 3-deoxy-manno-octulosonate cytidylyltransferase [Acidobacteriota bacterium]|nr:3-deoxy-manno-octulosonate cytidylyltransferase [Acidobacteriota bacterium]
MRDSRLTSVPRRVVAIIPARYASTRLPGKPLADIGGQPMIEHVYRHAREASSVDQVLVATDDKRIADAVADFGGVACMTRDDHASGTDRLAEVATQLNCELVVNLQADEPLVSGAMIDATVTACGTHPDTMMSTLRCPLEGRQAWQDPHIVKVAVDCDDRALFFSRAPIGLDRVTGTPTPTRVDKHIGLYVYRRAFLITLSRLKPTPLECAERLEQLRVLEHGHRIQTTRTEQDPIGVDTPEDLDRVRQLLAAGATV